MSSHATAVWVNTTSALSALSADIKCGWRRVAAAIDRRN